MKYVILAALLLAVGAASTLARRARITITFLGGLAFVYTGQRLFVTGDLSLPLTVLGLAAVFASVAFRVRARTEASDVAAEAQGQAFTWQLVAVSALAVYGLTTPTVTDALGLQGDTLDRVTAVLSALWPILLVVGTAPMVWIDTTLAAHPVAVPPGGVKHAVGSGLSVALAAALMFPVNYLADAYNVEADYSYFRVTEPGSSTEALVRNLDAPVDVLLFYPPGNETKEKLLPYFRELERLSGGNLTVEVVDQPSNPVVAEELSIRDNGYVVVRRDDAREKFKIDEDLKRARRDLKTLDETFHKNLLRLTKGKRVAYMLTGHGEATHRTRNPVFKLTEFRKTLRDQNYQVEDFGLKEGSAEGVPDDAALVVVAAPVQELLPEEVEVLKRWVDGGGALLVYVDAGRDRLSPLLAHLGLQAGEHALGHDRNVVPITGQVVDRYNLFSNRFGSHASTSTLSKFASRASVVMLGTLPLTETGEATAPGPLKHTKLVRSFPDTWEDVDQDFTRDPDEPAAVHTLAYAVEGPQTAPFRAIVVGDIGVAGDFVVARSKGSGQFTLDATRWLIGEEDLVGEVSNEEDVRIEHTKDEDTVWFYGIIFGMPLLVLMTGVVLVRGRNRQPSTRAS